MAVHQKDFGEGLSVLYTLLMIYLTVEIKPEKNLVFYPVLRLP